VSQQSVRFIDQLLLASWINDRSTYTLTTNSLRDDYSAQGQRPLVDISHRRTALHGNKTGRILSSVNAICIHISLTDSSCVEVTCGPTSSADTVMGASASEQRWEECFHLFIPYAHALQSTSLMCCNMYTCYVMCMLGYTQTWSREMTQQSFCTHTHHDSRQSHCPTTMNMRVLR